MSKLNQILAEKHEVDSAKHFRQKCYLMAQEIADAILNSEGFKSILGDSVFYEIDFTPYDISQFTDHRVPFVITFQLLRLSASHSWKWQVVMNYREQELGTRLSFSKDTYELYDFYWYAKQLLS